MALDFSKFGTPVQPEKSAPDFSAFGTLVEAPAAPVVPPVAPPAEQGLPAVARASTPAGFMLRPEFVEQVRSEYGNLPPEQRRAALQEASMGRGVRADAAKRILADLAVEDQRRREMTQGREGLMGILAAAQQQPAPRQPAAPAGPAPRVQFPDVSPTIGDIMDMVPEQERIQRRLAQDEAARTLEAAESSIEATRAREQERMGGLEQIGKSFTEVGIPTAEAGALGLTAVAQQAQMAKIGDQLKELEAQGQGNTPQADRLRRVLEHYSSRQQVYLGDLAQAQAKLSTAPVYRGVRELTEAETFTDAAKAFARNPVSIVMNLTAQSLPSMLPALVLGVINPALGVAAMGGSSYGVEFGNELLGFAREKGFDPTNPQQMAQFMQNSELLREGVNRAGTKAGIVAAGDMLLTGLAAKTLVPKRITGPVAKNVTNVGVQMGVQGVGGAGTEALAQYVTTGEIKPGEVVAEAVGELGGAPAEVFTQTAQARREARAAQAAQAAQPPAPAAPVPPAPAAPAERIEPTFDERAVPPAPAERVEPTLEGAPVPSPAAQTMREQQDAIEKMEREALKLEPGEPVQEAAKDALQIEPEPPQTELPRQAVVEVPVGQLKLSEDVPQFKAGADKAGIVEPLGGKFERTGVAPIQVWRRNDGRMEIISGRHRFDLAKRSGEKTIPAQIHDESKGFTRDMAAVLDAELNIRDGQGKVKDYVNYFKGTGLDRETANARGLLARAPGKRAFSIANDGSDELIAGVRADQIPDEAAYLIAINAPGDARLQGVGIKAVADGKSAATAVNMMQAVRALAGEADTTTDMFGFDDSAIKEAEEMAKIAGRKQREIQTRLSAISGAARNPQLAASEGIDIRDPQAVNNRINELRQMKASWDNWSTNPQLVAEVRAERGVAPPTLAKEEKEFKPYKSVFGEISVEDQRQMAQLRDSLPITKENQRVNWIEIPNGYAYKQYVIGNEQDRTLIQEVRGKPTKDGREPPIIVRGISQNNVPFMEAEATGKLDEVLSGEAFAQFKEFFESKEKTRGAAPPVLAPVDAETVTPAEEAADISNKSVRDKLNKIAKNLGVLVFETGEGFKSSREGVVSIPAEDKQVESALSSDHVFAHELGHAIMQKRGISYDMPKSEVIKFIPDFENFERISKAFRPSVWSNKEPRIRRHARKPNEVIADVLGSYLLGDVTRKDIASLALKDYDLGETIHPTVRAMQEPLKRYTPEESVAKAEREERARKEEQAKPAEVPPAEEFVLTGSDRAADEAAARGQMELTAPAEEAPKYKTGELVRFTMPGVGGPIGRAGTIQRILDNGDLEIRSQQGDIVIKSPNEVSKTAEAEPGEAVDENDIGFRGASDEEVKEVAGAFKDAEQSQEDERETRVFDPPTKNEVVRIEDKVRVYTKDRGYMTLDEAKQEIAKWRQHALEQGDTGVNANKVVLSLFDLTGEWSMPWDAAGYQVFRFDIQTDPEYGDVSKFSGDFFNDIFGAFEGQDIYAILAACPCTDFASSGARHFAAKDEDGRTLESVELVRQTLATIEYFKPSVWAIENPVGRIEKLTGLPPWRSSWNPNHFGDPYTKKTLLWGRFNADMPIAPVEATEGSKMHRMYGGKSKATKNARSVTPEGFAYAFFMANNAVDNPVLAISNKYDLMDRAVFEEAVNAGMTYEEISEVIDDPYYFDKDYKRAEADLREAAKAATSETVEELPDFPVPEGFVPKKGRVTGMVMAARELAAGRITKAQYDQYVEKYMPIRMILGGNLESPIEDGMMREILTKKIKGKKKDPKLVNAPVADGTRVGLRMDIPALDWGRENGVNGSVVSIHRGKDPDEGRGENVSYKSTGYIKNVVMAPRDEERAFGIAQQLEGKQGEKSPQQTIEGEWVNMSPEETFRLVKQNLDNPDWVQVSLDPLRHSYFYARDSKRPVLSADEALQVGRFVLVKNPVYGEREQFLYSIDTNQPKEYDFSSQEPIAGEQSNRSPSLKRKVKTLNRQREDGRITPEKFVEEVDAAVKADEERKYYKATAKRVRGADYIRQRLLEAKRRGELSEEGVNLAEWFILQNENLVGDLGIAIKSPKKGGTAGFYESSRRIMALMKESGNEATIVHEILHHTERMMPVEMQDAIRKEWLRSLVSAQKKAKTPEEKFFFEAVMNHHFGSGTIGDLKDAAAFTLRLSKMGLDTGLYDRSYRIAIEMLRRGMVKMSDYQFVNPSEFWAVNASEIVKGRYEAIQGGLLARMKNWLKELGQKIKGIFGLKSDAPLIKALNSLSEGDGTFVSRDMLSSQEDYLQIGKNIYGRKPLAAWTMPDETKLDADLIYRLQNKQIDLKRAVDAIEEAAGGIEDRWDAYLQEELYHGRTARETANFLREEVRPLLEAMNKEGVSIADLEEYLHNRFAEERNIQIAKVNPAYPNDGTPFSGGSGIDTADAQAYLNNLTPEQRTKYERLAKMVDGITKGTREYLVNSGLEERSTIDTWESAAPNYVPLNRGDVEYSTTVGTGTGLGYSVRGPASRRATGSRRTVVDILPNIIMQRERAIVRGEKNRVAVAVYGLAVQNPNSEVWLAVNPQAKGSKKKAVDELINMGLTAQDAEGLMEEPAATVVDPQTGLVTKRVNPVLRGAGNVLAARVNGQDRYVFFNTQNPRAARMVAALKNMDADQLGMAMSLVASLTRWFASINTQYNPVFGIYNFLRDFQGAAIQLSGTELADARAKVLSPVNIAGAMSGIYSTLRKERAGVQPATKQWADLWRDFQAQGGQTGYRDMFSRSQERAEALQREINRMNQGVVRRGGNAIFGWLADYNETLENAVRLSAYKAGLDAGMSKERAASLAKNLTVNFNRKGQVATTAGAWYAFFNSAVQGTTRLLQTVAKMERPGDITSLRLTKAGKVVIYGGLLIGTAQAIALAAMGYDENEPPDFVKDRNLIIPIGDGKYLAWPLPLGYHVIPAISRILTEWMIAGGKDPAKRIAHLADVILDAFNPIGNAGWSAQSIAPTVFDPIVALFENQDWTGKKIAREDISKLDPTPGYTRAKENASWINRQLSYYLNLASGGDKDKPGIFSPTPDQLDYFAGQVTGGLGREILKAVKTTEATITGEELAPYNIPLAGRFYGDTKAGYAESARFYKNLEELNILDNQLKGMQARKESVTAFTKENPKLRLVESARTTERNIRQLRKERKDLVEKGASREAVKAKENLITNQMKRLNDQVKKLEETPRKPAN